MSAKVYDWRKALISNRKEIVEGLANADAVADCLLSDQILTPEMYETIVQIKQTAPKNRQLLDTLHRRGQNSVLCLYKAFMKTGNEKLTDCLHSHLKIIEQRENFNEPQKWPPEVNEQQEMKKQPLLTIKDVNGTLVHDYNNLDEVYKMQNKKRGKVIIINNVIFDDIKWKSSEGSADDVKKKKELKLKKREGSNHDVDNMKEMFEQLHFEVVTNKKDLTAEEMFRYLEDEKDKTEWKEMECLVLILMSHGEGGSIYGRDGMTVEINELTNLFSSTQCKDLDGKPRLVFVQACRDESKGEVECFALNKSKNGDNKDTPMKKEAESQDVLDSEPIKQEPTPQQDIKHPLADFLVAFATPDRAVSYRHTGIGSWFLCAVMWAFKYYAYKEELHHLLIRVNRIVARGKGEPGYAPKFTVSEVRSNLRKKFYFFPGVYGNPTTDRIRLIDK